MLGSPDEGDVAPPLEEVLPVVGGKVPVLHLLDVCPSCKCLVESTEKEKVNRKTELSNLIWHS